MRLKMEILSYSYKLESRPGQLLIDHLKNTAFLCSRVREKKLSVSQEESEFLSETAWRIGFTHDLGKATKYFQDYLQEKNEKRRLSLKNKDETHHSFLSSLFTYQIISEYLKKKNFSEHRLYRYFPFSLFLLSKSIMEI